MTENDFTLQDRLGVIRDTIKKFGEENFYISFSGGKDSTILSKLVDMAVPGNRIPRVFFDTGIEYNAIREFVSRQPNVVVIKPTQAIKPMLEKYGYPFKSKEHSHLLMTYQNSGFGKSVMKYLGRSRRCLCEPWRVSVQHQCQQRPRLRSGLLSEKKEKGDERV